MQQLSELKTLLETPKKIFITTHRKPDGDALGSSLALYHYLLKKGHEPVVVSPTDYGIFLHWMPGNPAVIIWDEEKELSQKHLNESELVFCLDFNHLGRIDDMGDAIRNSTAPKVMIDHHLEPEGFDTYRHWNPDSCATAMLVYEFIRMMGDEEMVDRNIATCIYTGLVTDSGSFRYPNVTAEVHLVVAKLIEAGIEHWRIHQNIYDTFSENRIRFFGHCLSNKLIVLPEYRAAYISVSREELREFNIRTGDTEGLVNYPMNIDSVVFAALIVERENVVKLSLRSKGTFPANEFSSKYFAGGGHLNAAGGVCVKNLAGAIDVFKAGLEEYRSLLVQA